MADKRHKDVIDSVDLGTDDSDELSGDEQPAAGREEDWEEWQGGGDDMDEDRTRSLFGPEVLPNAEAAMDHDAAKHGFDIRQFSIQERLDDYGIMRVINFIREQVAAGQDPRPMLASPPKGAPAPWHDDKYLRPFLEDDALLFYDFEDAGCTANSAALVQGADGAQQPLDGGASAAEVARLQQENEALRVALEAMRLAFMPEELRGEGNDAGPSSAGDGPSTSGAAAAAPAVASTSSKAGLPSAESVAARAARKVDQAYFDSYSYFDIHRTMLGDTPRTEAYRQALEENPSLIKGKVVMDVGCGTGILSLFACRAGAAKVVAIDGSERIAGYARQHARLAGYDSASGGPMRVVVGKLEELPKEQLPAEKVDVIVSEWMGYALLFETMLATVLHARDLYLKPGGAVLPDLASIFVAGATHDAGGLDFWRNVYGFSMGPVADSIRASAQQEAVVTEVKAQELVTPAVKVKELDMCTMTADDQDFTSEFVLHPNPELAQPTTCASLVLWFDTDFSARHCPEHPVTLSTSPAAPVTHWAQTLLQLRTPVALWPAGKALPDGAGAGGVSASLKVRLSMVRSRRQHRSLDISVEYSAALGSGRIVSEAQLYHMSITAP